MFLFELQEEKSQALALQYEATEIKETHQQEKSERNKTEKKDETLYYKILT